MSRAPEAPSPANDRPATTELRLLEAAGEVFAEKGYRAATIRDIIKRAGANIAAVNYHFGDKEKLYAATFRYARQACVAKFPVFEPNPKADTPREELRQYVQTLFRRMLDKGRPAWQWKLMAREMIEPTPVLDEMVEDTIRGEFSDLRALVARITGLSADDERVRRCGFSVIGQAMFYRHAQAVIQRMAPEQGFEPDDLDVLAEHVTDFSYAAMERLRKGVRS